MTDGLNRATLLGNLGADPETRVTPGGKEVTRIRLATSYTYLDDKNERQELTEWHSCTIWGKRGTGLAKILKKGDRVYLEGRIQTSKYEKDGVDHYATEIVVLQAYLCGKAPGKPGDAAKPGRQPVGDEPPAGLGRDDDIPF
ncbi:MAG: single-stranded DNA-binding protein [Solirubrobacterales bacterium]